MNLHEIQSLSEVTFLSQISHVFSHSPTVILVTPVDTAVFKKEIEQEILCSKSSNNFSSGSLPPSSSFPLRYSFPPPFSLFFFLLPSSSSFLLSLPPPPQLSPWSWSHPCMHCFALCSLPHIPFTFPSMPAVSACSHVCRASAHGGRSCKIWAACYRIKWFICADRGPVSSAICAPSLWLMCLH